MKYPIPGAACVWASFIPHETPSLTHKERAAGAAKGLVLGNSSPLVDAIVLIPIAVQLSSDWRPAHRPSTPLLPGQHKRDHAEPPLITEFLSRHPPPHLLPRLPILARDAEAQKGLSWWPLTDLRLPVFAKSAVKRSRSPTRISRRAG